MSSRNSILQRLRAGRPGQVPAELTATADRHLFRDFPGESSETLLEAFAERLLDLQGEFFAAANADEAAEKVLHLLETENAEKCLAQADPLIDRVLGARSELQDSIDRGEALELDSPAFAQYPVGISAADFLVARTGSIVLRSSSAGGRRLSVLPPLHIVLARQAQIVPSLDAALHAFEQENGDWSYASIITGPSRTADIEKILVLGAHGPKRLAVVLLTEEV